MTGTINLLFQGGVLQFSGRFSTHYNAVKFLLLQGRDISDNKSDYQLIMFIYACHFISTVFSIF